MAKKPLNEYELQLEAKRKDEEKRLQRLAQMLSEPAPMGQINHYIEAWDRLQGRGGGGTVGGTQAKDGVAGYQPAAIKGVGGNVPVHNFQEDQTKRYAQDMEVANRSGGIFNSVTDWVNARSLSDRINAHQLTVPNNISNTPAPINTQLPLPEPPMSQPSLQPSMLGVPAPTRPINTPPYSPQMPIPKQSLLEGVRDNELFPYAPQLQTSTEPVMPVSEANMAPPAETPISPNFVDFENKMKGLKAMGNYTSFRPIGTDATTGAALYGSQKGGFKALMPQKGSTRDTYGFGYGQTVPPESVDRIIEGIYQGNLDSGNIPMRQKTVFLDAWAKKYPNIDMVAREAQTRAIKSTQVARAVNTMESIISPTQLPDGTWRQPLADTLIASHNMLNMAKAGEYGPATRLVNMGKMWYKEASGDTDISIFNNLKASLAAEISSALSAGGVPTDMRMEVELANIRADVPHEAFVSAIEAAKEVLHARKDAFTSKLPLRTQEAILEKAQEEAITKLQEINDTYGRDGKNAATVQSDMARMNKILVRNWAKSKIHKGLGISDTGIETSTGTSKGAVLSEEDFRNFGN